MKKTLFSSSSFVKYFTILPTVVVLSFYTPFAQKIERAFIEEELARVETNPDQSIEISINAPLQFVFDFLSTRLNEYIADARSLEFNHTSSESSGELGKGSVRKLTMEDNDFLIQRFLQFDPPSSYAYLTDMEESTLQAPLNYSLARYEFSEPDEGKTLVRVSVVYEPSSRLLAFFVRRVFNSALRKDFQRARDIIESNYQQTTQ